MKGTSSCSGGKEKDELGEGRIVDHIIGRRKTSMRDGWTLPAPVMCWIREGRERLR